MSGNLLHFQQEIGKHLADFVTGKATIINPGDGDIYNLMANKDLSNEDYFEKVKKSFFIPGFPKEYPKEYTLDIFNKMWRPKLDGYLNCIEVWAAFGDQFRDKMIRYALETKLMRKLKEAFYIGYYKHMENQSWLGRFQNKEAFSIPEKFINKNYSVLNLSEVENQIFRAITSI